MNSDTNNKTRLPPTNGYPAKPPQRRNTVVPSRIEKNDNSDDEDPRKPETEEEKQIKRQELVKHDRHFNPLTTERIESGDDLPPLTNWSEYRDWGHKKFRVTNPRLPRLNRCKNCRRCYRVITVDGSVSDAFFAMLHNENTIIGVIVLAFINTTIQTLNQDAPSTASTHFLSFEFIARYIGAVFVTYGVIGLARKLYGVLDSGRNERQRVQRAVFNDYEDSFEDKMVVFTSRGWRFDSAGPVDAREAAQALWSEEYDEITDHNRCPRFFNQFFLFEDDKLRKKKFPNSETFIDKKKS